MGRTYTIRRVLLMTLLFGLSFGCMRTFLTDHLPVDGLGVLWGLAGFMFFGAALGVPFRHPFWFALLFLALFIAYVTIPPMQAARE